MSRAAQKRQGLVQSYDTLKMCIFSHSRPLLYAISLFVLALSDYRPVYAVSPTSAGSITQVNNILLYWTRSM
jgi:hypothetical protein